jgi:hypothetical protein
MEFKFTRKQLDEGIEIKINGCKGDPTEKAPGTSLYLEHYEGKVLVHVWDGTSQDCQTIELKQLTKRK